MLQELIPGDGAAQLSFAALCRDGEVLASLTACRTRQFPMRLRARVELRRDDRRRRRRARCALPARGDALHGAGRGRVQARRAERRDPCSTSTPGRGRGTLCGRAGVDFPLPAVADGGGRGGGARPRGARRALGAHVHRRARARGSSRARPASPAAYLRSLRGRSSSRSSPATTRCPRYSGPSPRRGSSLGGSPRGGRCDRARPTGRPRCVAYLARAPAATPFHHPHGSRCWGEVFRYEMSACCVEAADGSLAGGLPVAEVSSRLTGRRLVALPFSDLCERLLARDAPAGSAIALGDALSELQRRRGVPLEVRGTGPALREAPPGERFHHHVLALGTDAAEVEAALRQVSGAPRASAARSAKGLETAVATDRAALEAFFRLHVVSPAAAGRADAATRFILGFESLFEAGIGFVLLVRREGAPVAAGVSSRRATRCLYKYGATDARFLPLRPNNLLFWDQRSGGAARTACGGLRLRPHGLGPREPARFKPRGGGGARAPLPPRRRRGAGRPRRALAARAGPGDPAQPAAGGPGHRRGAVSRCRLRRCAASRGPAADLRGDARHHARDDARARAAAGPADFGLFAMATIGMELLSVFSGLWLGSALVLATTWSSGARGRRLTRLIGPAPRSRSCSSRSRPRWRRSSASRGSPTSCCCWRRCC